MDTSRHARRTKVATSKRVTYALAGAGVAIMALPLVTAILPQEAGASRVPGGAASVQVTQSIVPTDPTTPRPALAALSGTVQVFNPGASTYTVGTGICTVEVIVNGAAGGNVQAGVAGRGSSVKGQFAVAAGEKYDITVGAYRGGGTGGMADLNGGGATKIVKQSTAALVIEAGGGGGDSLIVLTRSDANQDTIPQTTSTGSTAPPFIKVNAIPGKGADAPGTTAPTPVNATVVVPVGDYASNPTSTTNFVQSASASANGSATASAEAVLNQEVDPGTTVQLAKVKVDVYAGGAGGGGSVNAGGASANAGEITSSTNFYAPTSTNPGDEPATSVFNAPYALGAAVGGSGGLNSIGNGFLKTAEGVNDQKDGKVTVREIACSAGGSTLPPLGGGRGANGPLLPFAVALVGAGIGLVLVRRRGTALPEA